MHSRHSVLALAAVGLSCLSFGPAWTQGGAATRPMAVAQTLPTPVAPARNAPRGGKPGALDAQQRAMVEKINGYLTGVHTLIGDFVQVGPDGRRTEGKFYLQKPGRMR